MADWKTIVASKVQARDAAIPTSWAVPKTDLLDVTGIPRACGILSEAEIRITESPARVLLEGLLDRTLTSEDVTRAFCKRAAIAHQLVRGSLGGEDSRAERQVNCLTEVFFDAAIARAVEIDTQYARTGRPLGPLHGLPISLKDTFRIEGTDTTIGFVAFANNPETLQTESEITRIMREAGAVLFCKTCVPSWLNFSSSRTSSNVPTAMMMSESYNNIWGYTSNPYNRDLSAGGSSGGEGALLALFGGSPCDLRQH